MSQNSKKHFCISFKVYSVFLKNDQLKMLNQMMYSMTLFDNFDFFPYWLDGRPFQNYALLRRRPWPVKSTQVFLISYMYSLM